ncbi:MAG: UDP-N-acetylmuramoyl-tripeptide--D-alanyl-D-alanine ligase [Clostridia bacterium]|nr:UDP-N-acetylmuramoyl-tripeptide--D-alanyl-D-alanine ligase [Clostridia bacterium]
MKPFLLGDAVRAIGGRYFGDDDALDRAITSVTSDSRTAGPGALFVAFKGSRVDGHDFMSGCVERGAAACVCEREPAEGERPAIQVDSSLRAIGALAAWHRGRFDIPVIGITGSVGKTTTKEMISAVLSQRYETHRTEKNFNNELGVPWTLLRLDEGHQVSVVEMGISDFGEMRRLTAMVRPTIAVFSVIGDAHLEFLGDRAGVLRAKSEMFEGMDATGLAVLNGDDPLLADCRPNMRRVLYGRGANCDVRAEDVKNLGEDGISLTICHSGGAFAARIPAFGGHMIYAALAAAAVGLELGLTEEEIARGIAAYHTVGDRARVLHAGGLTVVSDCYNANPNSCRAALDSLAALRGRRVCVLGDMLELGPQTARLHSDVGAYAAALGIEKIIACGPLSRHIAEGAKASGGDAAYFSDRDALLEALPELIRSGDSVLVKASRGMAFEKVVEKLTNMRR